MSSDGKPRAYLAHYFSSPDFTHHYGQEQRVYQLAAETEADALGEAPSRKSEFERDTGLHLGGIQVYEVTSVIKFNLDIWLRAQREAKDRAEYDRLKAKFDPAGGAA